MSEGGRRTLVLIIITLFKNCKLQWSLLILFQYVDHCLVTMMKHSYRHLHCLVTMMKHSYRHLRRYHNIVKPTYIVYLLCELSNTFNKFTKVANLLIHFVVHQNILRQFFHQSLTTCLSRYWIMVKFVGNFFHLKLICLEKNMSKI